MVKVKLLCDVAEGGSNFLESAKAARQIGIRADSPHFPKLKAVTKRVEGKVVSITEYRKDTVVTMAEVSAQKWVEKGLCVILDETAKE